MRGINKVKIIMLERKRTKIVATLGPSSSGQDVVRKFIEEGVNVFRINFSHIKKQEYQSVEKTIAMIRSLSQELGKNVSVLADLQGPKLRVGEMKEGTELTSGQLITFVTGEPFVGDKEKIYMNYSLFPKDVNAGERVLLDDGKFVFEVVSTNRENEVIAKVIQGGVLKSKKGVNLPNTKVSLPALTEKDREDAIFAISQEVDWIALSFVRNSKDILDLRDVIKEHSDQDIPIIAKIEKPEAVENIDQIIAYCDGLMVARGDLGVELPPQEVPMIQKDLVRKAKLSKIPVIIATQMMESMMNSITPSRAEVNDVANSVMDGADAVMLSGETSVGAYPVEVIKTMSNVIKSVENSDLIKVPRMAPFVESDRYITKSVCYQASVMSEHMNAKIISTLTNSGYTAFQISALRPKTHILVFTENKRLLNRLSLLWGVTTFFYDKFVSTDETVEDMNTLARDMGYVDKGDITISLTAMPVQDKGRVNSILISRIE